MPRTWDQLGDELSERGYQYIGETRLREFINDAVQIVHREERWPFRYRELTQALPYTDTSRTLGPIDHISRQPRGMLWPRHPSELREDGHDLTLAGAPRYYYVVSTISTGAGAKQLKSYPVSSETLIIAHYTLAAWVSDAGAEKLRADAATDEAVIPDDYLPAVLKQAETMCAADNQDDDAVVARQAEYDRLLTSMRDELLDDYDEPGYIEDLYGY